MRVSFLKRLRRPLKKANDVKVNIFTASSSRRAPGEKITEMKAEKATEILDVNCRVASAESIRLSAQMREEAKLKLANKDRRAEVRHVKVTHMRKCKRSYAQYGIALDQRRDQVRRLTVRANESVTAPTIVEAHMETVFVRCGVSTNN